MNSIFKIFTVTFFIGTLCMVSFNALGNSKVDSLTEAYDKAIQDTIKINIKMELAKALEKNNKKEAIDLLNEAYRFSDSIGYANGKIASKLYLAYVFLHKRELDNAINNFNESLELHSAYGSQALLPDVLLGIGTAYMYNGEYQKSESFFNEGVALTGKNNLHTKQGDFFKNIGISYAYQTNYKLSIEYFTKAIDKYKLNSENKGIADCYTNIGVIYNYMGNHQKSIDYQVKAIAVYRIIGKKYFLAKGLNNLGVSYDDLNQYEKAIECYSEALAIQIELNDKKGISSCYNNTGEVHKDRGDYAKAIEFYEKSLRIDKEIEDKEGIAICQLNIGNIHFIQDDFEKAHKYYGEALRNANNIGEKRIVANVLNAIGELFIEQKQYKSALTRFEQAIEISSKIGEQSEEAKSNFLIGEVYRNLQQYADAIEYYTKAMQVHEQLGEIGEASMDNIRIGESLLGMSYIPKAINYIEKGLKEAEQIGVIENVRLAAEILARAYEKNRNFEMAYKYANLYKTLHDSIFTLESQKQIHIVENRFEIERKEAEIQLQNAEIEKQDAVLKQRLILQKSLIGGIVAIFIVVILIIINYVRIHKAKAIIVLQKDQIAEKNEELRQSNEELRATVDTVNEQKYEIERATKELTDSIYYAQYIQKAILPKKQNFTSKTSDHFVLFKPKDIVSGDFYWTTEIENKTIIAAADCTGHGVPGAFMSMLGVSFLNDIINKEYTTHTGVVLQRLRNEVINALQQKGILGEQRDGMDIALCSIDFENMELQFSGAHNPLYIIRSKNHEPITEVNATEYNDYVLYELKGDRMPVALYEKMDRFSDRTIKIFKDDKLYMFSDGYIDQFGGKEGKRFKSRVFKEVLLRNSIKGMYDQKCALEAIFVNWKGTYEQIDDVMIVGIQI